MDKMYSCLELNTEAYRLFSHAMNRPTAKDMCHQIEATVSHCFVVIAAERHAFSWHSCTFRVFLASSTVSLVIGGAKE